MANNGTNGRRANGIEGNPVFAAQANHPAPAGPAPQNGQGAPAPAQTVVHEQADVAPVHPTPEPLLAQGLAPEPALGDGEVPEPAQEPAAEIAPEIAPGVAPMPIANDDTEDSPLKGSLKGLEHILLPGNEENA
ncbi:hypothetical protein FS749_016026 [Ceratobasidium sp. UAMH 11750]|nr:hypothetical protein FS749_016026 [Ceratobasidium sp. UAMH 11750]